jgi:hypothetical protein
MPIGHRLLLHEEVHEAVLGATQREFIHCWEIISIADYVPNQSKTDHLTWILSVGLVGGGLPVANGEQDGSQSIVLLFTASAICC